MKGKREEWREAERKVVGRREAQGVSSLSPTLTRPTVVVPVFSFLALIEVWYKFYFIITLPE